MTKLIQKKIEMTGSGSGVTPRQPDPLEVEIPLWLREKYPDYAKAFDAIVEYNQELLDYLQRLEDKIGDS